MAKSSYEVHIRREGRWRIDAAFDDQATAERFAAGVLRQHGTEEVKVMKFRPFVGFEVETCVFHRKAPEGAETVMGLSGTAEGAPVCQRLDELYGFESRVVIGRLLHQFLDKHSITASELLHGWAYARRLDSQGTLLRAGQSAVARYQAETMGLDGRERLRCLSGLVDAALIRLRDFYAERKRLPPFDWNDLERGHRMLGLEVAPQDVDFAFLAQLTEALSACSSLPAKLDRLVAATDAVTVPRVAVLLDGVMADALGSAEVLRDVMGAQPNLATSIGVLSDILLDRPIDKGANPVTSTLLNLARSLAQGRVPYCRTVLVDRVVRSLAGEQPLDRRDPGSEALLLATLEQRLIGPDGAVLGGAAVTSALQRRSVRHRQAVLRKLGMHDIADSLGANPRK